VSFAFYDITYDAVRIWSLQKLDPTNSDLDFQSDNHLSSFLNGREGKLQNIILIQ
jgi:hypothetical protein